MELFAGKPLLGPDGSEVDAEKALKGKMIALYFSAMWCPHCRQFTPKLTRFYNALKDSSKDFEIVLVSRDREDEDLKEYLTEHCGVGSEFHSETKESKKYEVPTIPALKVLNADGSVLIADARNEVVVSRWTVKEETGHRRGKIERKGGDNPVQLFEEWQKKL